MARVRPRAGHSSIPQCSSRPSPVCRSLPARSLIFASAAAAALRPRRPTPDPTGGPPAEQAAAQRFVAAWSQRRLLGDARRADARRPARAPWASSPSAIAPRRRRRPRPAFATARSGARRRRRHRPDDGHHADLRDAARDPAAGVLRRRRQAARGLVADMVFPGLAAEESSPAAPSCRAARRSWRATAARWRRPRTARRRSPTWRPRSSETSVRRRPSA